ncbi:MAG: DUF87 domain-containing protein [Candidatus Anstonellales archaeon]
MAKKERVREVLLYSEKISENDVKNFFTQIMKSRLPLFGFLDLSDILSPNIITLIITRKLNTVQFFIHEKKNLDEISMLLFPYKLSDPFDIELSKKSSFFPVPKIYVLIGSQDFLSFLLKEKIDEVHLTILKIFGKFIATGTAIDEHSKKSIFISTSPEKFLIVDLAKNPSVYIEVLEPVPKKMSVSSQYPVFEETGLTLGVDNFDVFQHTLIAGASGTGKSKLLFILTKAISQKYKDDVRIVLIDPHGEFSPLFPKDKIVNLIDNYIEPLEVGTKTPLTAQLIAQLLSFSIGQENKYSERVLFYAINLLSSIDKMNLKNVSLLLTDSKKRAEFLSVSKNNEVKRFFEEEFNEIYLHHFKDAILPILNFVGEYEIYFGGEKKKESLPDLLEKNRITVISFNPNFFGKRMINFLSGAIINQMYILAMSGKLTTKTILIVDELYRVQTLVMRDILSEARKFNLYMYFSVQYLGQLIKDVHDSVLPNVRNIIAFKLNKEDAAIINSIMEIKVEEYFKKARSQTEIEESKKEIFVRLNQRDCMVRLFDGKKYLLPMKLRVVDIKKYGYDEKLDIGKAELGRPSDSSYTTSEKYSHGEILSPNSPSLPFLSPQSQNSFSARVSQIHPKEDKLKTDTLKTESIAEDGGKSSQLQTLEQSSFFSTLSPKNEKVLRSKKSTLKKRQK